LLKKTFSAFASAVLALSGAVVTAAPASANLSFDSALVSSAFASGLLVTTAANGTDPEDDVSFGTLDPWEIDGVDGHTVEARMYLFPNGCDGGPDNMGLGELDGSDAPLIRTSATVTIPATFRTFGDPAMATPGKFLAMGYTLKKTGYFQITLFGTPVEVGGAVCSRGGGGTEPPVVAPPYTGPVVSAPAGLSARPGSSVVLDGNRLSGVSKAEIAGLDAQVSVLSDGQISIVIPSGLSSGAYDLVITSDSGKLTVQGAIVVRGAAVAGPGSGVAGEARPSTRRVDDSSVKVWVFEAYGAGKVQIMVNGEEVAWVRAADASDPKLRGGRLVRTVSLELGKNVVEVLVDGKQVRRTVYTR
jgi:hypothetical protein